MMLLLLFFEDSLVFSIFLLLTLFCFVLFLRTRLVRSGSVGGVFSTPLLDTPPNFGAPPLPPSSADLLAELRKRKRRESKRKKKKEQEETRKEKGVRTRRTEEKRDRKKHQRTVEE